MTRVIVAAGGGGDAVAAAMVDAAYRPGSPAGSTAAPGPAVILSYAWDRLLIGPVAGPLGASHFEGLRPLTPSVYAVPADARAIPPAGSTLPRLASELPHTFALLDPHQGADGIARQLRELVAELAPDGIDVLDVGGDILAHGDEPTLKSPLGDALTLAALGQIGAEVRLLIAGPGLDGEIPAPDLSERLGAHVHTFSAAEAEPVGGVLEWHPSEAMSMLAATARGVRGLCEMRGAGPPVPLTDQGPTLHEADPHEALRRNTLAQRLRDTTSLDEAERVSREVGGSSEIDDERAQALWLGQLPARDPEPDAILARLAAFEDDARGRGITHATFRRVTEVLGFDGALREDLRELLVRAHPERYAAPLWRIPDA